MATLPALEFSGRAEALKKSPSCLYLPPLSMGRIWGIRNGATPSSYDKSNILHTYLPTVMGVGTGFQSPMTYIVKMVVFSQLFITISVMGLHN